MNRSPGPLMLALACALAAGLAAPDADAGRYSMLQGLMKRIDGFVSNGNLHAAAEILKVVKPMGPEEYPRWAAIAEKGRAAAAAGDGVAARAACRDCHDAYRDQYRNKYGSKAPDGKGPPTKD